MANVQLTKEQMGQVVAGVLFGGLFLYLYLFWFWLPTSKKIDESSQKVAAIESDINNARRQKAKYKDLEAKLTEVKAEKDAAEKKLPHDKKLPDLLRTITTLSRKYRVSITNINPSGSAKVEYFTKNTYQISLKGNYHDIARFLTAIGLEERIMTSENLNLNAGPGEYSGSASFTLAAYQYNG